MSLRWLAVTSLSVMLLSGCASKEEPKPKPEPKTLVKAPAIEAAYEKLLVADLVSGGLSSEQAALQAKNTLIECNQVILADTNEVECAASVDGTSEAVYLTVSEDKDGVVTVEHYKDLKAPLDAALQTAEQAQYDIHSETGFYTANLNELKTNGYEPSVDQTSFSVLLSPAKDFFCMVIATDDTIRYATPDGNTLGPACVTDPRLSTPTIGPTPDGSTEQEPTATPSAT